MNILDRHYPEISFKTDAEDLQIMVDMMNCSAERVAHENNISIKIIAIMLKEIRYKFTMKIEQKKGTSKSFLVKLKAYQIYALYQVLMDRQETFSHISYEYNCILKYKNIFHQKLTGL